MPEEKDVLGARILPRLAFCSALQIIGLLLFLRGFIPLKPVGSEVRVHKDAGADGGNSTNQWNSNQRQNPKFSRLVIMLIDALRADFVFGLQNKYTPYLSTLIRRNETLRYVTGQ